MAVVKSLSFLRRSPRESNTSPREDAEDDEEDEIEVDGSGIAVSEDTCWDKKLDAL